MKRVEDSRGVISSPAEVRSQDIVFEPHLFVCLCVFNKTRLVLCPLFARRTLACQIHFCPGSTFSSWFSIRQVVRRLAAFLRLSDFR